MKKTIISIMLLGLLMLSACQKADVPLSVDNFTRPITCKTQGQTIKINPPAFTGIPIESVPYTMAYKFKNGTTDFDIILKDDLKTFLVDKTGKIVDRDYQPPRTPSDPFRPEYIGADYSIGEDLYAYEGETTPDGEALCGIMDRQGNIITEPLYVGHINFNYGYAIVQKKDGTYVSIDTTGKEFGTLPDESGICGDKVAVYQEGEPGNYTQYLYDIYGNRLSEGFDSIGYFYNGLALITKANMVGIINDKGKVVLEPSILYDDFTYPPKNRGFSFSYMEEDAFIIPMDGEYAVITIDR